MNALHRSNNGVGSWSYLLRDHLGSVDTITDENGTVLQRRNYDPFGKARDEQADDTKQGPIYSALGIGGQLDSAITPRGFTDHEHLDDAQLIHMNGRVYDYKLGRFLSVDPVIQSPGNSQSMNPYSYIMNNPLAGVDPSGYCSAKTGTRIKTCRDLKVGIYSGDKKLDSTVIKDVNVRNDAEVAQAKYNGVSQIVGKAQAIHAAATEIGGPEFVAKDTTPAATGTNGETAGGMQDGLPGCPDCRMITSPGNSVPGTAGVTPQKASPISRGAKGVLTDDEIGNIIFNETRSLSGKEIGNVRKDIANIIINGDEQYGSKRPGTASTTLGKITDKVELATLKGIRTMVQGVRIDRQNGIDSTKGAVYFNFRDPKYMTQFNKTVMSPRFGLPVTISRGPLNNSYPTKELGSSNIYFTVVK